jgi:hypothetical protein
MNSRIEEFTHDGKNFIYFDLSEFKTNDEYKKFIETAKGYMPKYAECSLHTITNIRGVSYDTETKRLVAEWMSYNKPYVKYGTVIGFDGIKRIMANAVFKISGRKNMTFVSNKEQAIEWLLRQSF